MVQRNADEIKAVEEKIAEKLLVKQREEYENKLEHLKKIQTEKGKSAAIFKLKEKVLGSRKEGSESVSMNDPVTGNMICNPEELKRASVDYLSSLLRNRDPKEGYEEDLKMLRILHEQRLNEECSDDESLSEKEFQTMLKKLKKLMVI